MPRPPTAGSGPLRWHTVELAPEAIGRYAAVLGYPDASPALEALARAVCGSAGGRAGVRAARAPAGPPPRLALLAERGAAVEAGISAQAKALERSCLQLRFVDYRQADRVAGGLAERLERRFGDELQDYRLSGIPRGGWLAAGLVARHLRRPLAATGSAAGELIVDDCALTGVALRRYARRLGDRPIIFAPLFAPRALGGEIERQSGRVRAVVAGSDLAENVLELPAAEYQRWRRRWRERLIEPPYWLGLTEFVCFSWNEPKRWVWNPVGECVEPGWRLLARERCLDARDDALPPPPAVPGAIRPGAGVVAAEIDGVIYVGDLRSGESWRLAGAAAGFWSALTRHGDRSRAVAEMVERFDVDSSTATRDLDRWLGELTARGLLSES